MFDGSHTAKKKISLGGKRAKEERDTFLQRTKKEREEREDLRKRNVSAITIQKIFRGRRLAKEWCENLRKGSWNGLASVNADSGEYNYEKVFKSLIIFGSTSKDLDAFIFVCKQIVKENNVNVLFKNQSDYVFLKKFSVACVELLKKKSGDETLTMLLIQVVGILSNPDIAKTNAPPISTMLIKNQVFAVARPLIMHPSFSNTVTAIIKQILVQAAATTTSKNREEMTLIVREFAWNILSINQLTQKLPKDALATLLSLRNTTIWNEMLEEIGSNGLQCPTPGCSSSLQGKSQAAAATTTTKNTPTAAAAAADSETMMRAAHLLVTIVRVEVVSSSFSASKESIVTFLRVIDALLSIVPPEASDREDEDNSNNSDDESLGGESTATAIATNSQLTPQLREEFNWMYAQLRQHLLSEKNLRIICKPLMSLDATSEISPLVVPPLCSTLVVLCKVFPNHRVNVLNVIGYSSYGLKNIWKWLVADRSGSKSMISQMTSGGGGLISESSWMTLRLFCMAYNHLLVTLDDEEFEKGVPMELSELVHVIRWLKLIVLKCFWQQSGDRFASASSASASSSSFASHGLSIPLEHKRSIQRHASSLLSQLWERNCSHAFAESKDWEAPRDQIEEIFAAMKKDMQLGDRIIESAASASDFGGGSQREQSSKAVQILQQFPFLLPFHKRVEQLRNFFTIQRMQSGRDEYSRGLPIRIHRNRVMEDAYAELGAASTDMTRRIQVLFLDEFGNPEQGIDGGGLFKEFLDTLTKAAYGPQYGLFITTTEGTLYPNPASAGMSEYHLQHFEFLGRVLGKALYEGVLVELPFALFFLTKILGKIPSLNHLASLDPQLYRNLLSLKTFDGDFADLSLNFTVTDDNWGAVISRDLIPNGSDVAVTQSNRFQYIHLVADYWLNKRIHSQCVAFMKGLQALIPREWLRMFNANELQLLISGSTSPVDVEDMRKHTMYGGGYTDDSPAIVMFWKVMGKFTAEQQRLLLRFATSCSRAPLLGFKELHPHFCIQKVPDEDRWPTASTCMNLLKLPNYSSEATMYERLLFAVSSNAGFDLS